MPRPESINIDEALKPAKTATPERAPASKSESIGERLRGLVSKAVDLPTGGANSTVSRAVKDMNYYREDD